MPKKLEDPIKANAKIELEAGEVLAAEYEYIGQTAFQANEDRARVLSYYLVTVGSLVGAILSSQSTLSKGIELAFAGLFALLAIFGTLTLMQLVQLRKAWTFSVLAMAEMKEFLIRKNPELAEAFLWRKGDVPPVKTTSITYLQALQVALLSAVAAACAVYFFVLALNGWALIAGLMGLLLVIAAQIEYLNRRFKAIKIEAEESVKKNAGKAA